MTNTYLIHASRRKPLRKRKAVSHDLPRVQPGEIPPLANAWRSVIALTPGRKWVTLLDWTTLETARLEIAAWEKLKPLPADGLSPRKARAAMSRLLRYVAPTRAIREALPLLGKATR